MKEELYPLVSICMPTFNGEKYISDSLNSALKQSYPNFEIVVSDDNSIDNTLEIVKSASIESNKSIRIVQHKPNGIGSNWNNCVKQAKGRFIKFLFQDDVLEEDCVSKMVKMMQTSEQIGLVYSKRHIISEDESPDFREFREVYGSLHKYWGELYLRQGIHSGTSYLKDSQFLNSPKNKIGEPSSVLIRKSCFNKVGYFNENLKQALDCEFWHRIMPHYDIAFLDTPLSSFRYHNQQASRKNKSNHINETEELYRMYYNKLLPYLHPKCKWKLRKRFNPFIRLLVVSKQFIKDA